MNQKTRQKLRTFLWPLAGLLASLVEIIQSDPDFYTKSWSELADRGLRALPFLLLGLIARKLLLTPPPNIDKTERPEDNQH